MRVGLLERCGIGVSIEVYEVVVAVGGVLERCGIGVSIEVCIEYA